MPGTPLQTVTTQPLVTYWKKEDTIDFTASAEIPAGSIVAFGEVLGYTKVRFQQGDVATAYVVGEVKVLNTSASFVVGDHLFLDPANNNVSNASGTGKYDLGLVIKDAASTDKFVYIRWDGVIVA
jgi:predicted RecA/RadA family phage recombinase